MYKVACLEIVGYCNGRCRYCPTGNGSMSECKSGCISPRDFADVIDRVQSLGLIDRDSLLCLYNWGEPMLHPQIQEILQILEANHLSYMISTNGSKLVRLPEGLSCLRELRFSFPGFSQASYDKMHGFAFEKVIANTVDFSRQVRGLGHDTRLTMAYHLYQFNIGEVRKAKDFCRQNRIEFLPYLAYLADYNQAKSWLSAGDDDFIRQVSSDLLLWNVRDRIKVGSLAYRCRQFDTLTIDEFGRVVLCCVLPKTHKEYVLGALSQFRTIEEIKKEKESRLICKECQELGIAYWHNESYCPDWATDKSLTQTQSRTLLALRDMSFRKIRPFMQRLLRSANPRQTKN